ncbi:hypothetical protein HYU95_05905 [Candidatus Daviesbacteria bacterium]|nr:hypothetical protein [Candidatus Daviesbacteria bacterium]
MSASQKFSVNNGFVPVYLLVVILVFLIIAGGVYYFGAGKNMSFPFKNDPKACNEEAKLCPNGSYVGREGPNCEFKQCPAPKPSIPDEAAEFLDQKQAKTDSKACSQDSDCALLACTGCFNAQWVKTAPPDLACLEYSGYSCECRENKCTEIKK